MVCVEGSASPDARMQFSAKSSNITSPRNSDFTSDDLSLIIGTCLPEAVAIVDLSNGQVVGGNSRLEELLGLDLKSEHEFRLEDSVHPEDQGLFNTYQIANFSSLDASLEIRVRDAEGGYRNVELHLSGFRWSRTEFLIVYIREVVDRTILEKELKEKVVEQKRKTLEAIKSSLLIYQFTEKIKKTPILTTSLLSAENETQLFAQAARILTCEGLNYKDVIFLMVEDENLSVCHSTRPVTRKTFPYRDESRYATFIDEQSDAIQAIEGAILVPLRSRGNLLGLIEVTLHPRERIFFDEYNLVQEWQNDALLTIGDMIALVLDNLRLYREVKHQSITDPLTGLYNRNYFIERLSEEIDRCIRKNRPISMIFVDVDQFKQINDTHGHMAGDNILRDLGEIFKHNLRGYDFVCRYGGDEFVILLPEVDVEGARKIASKLREVVHEHDFKASEDSPKSIPVSISLGISVLDKDLDEDHFLRSADAALYEAKASGRNRMGVNNAKDSVAKVAETE
jgi:diguanylate cyclase (GGDEF)-like protein